MPNPSPLDLATLQACKDWIGITNNNADSKIQRCLTAWSINFLRMTGRGPRNSLIPATSPFNQTVTYSEVYDGNGNNELFLRNFPITAVSALSVYGSAIPAQSQPGSGSTGYAIDNQGKSIVLINSAIAGGAWLYSGGPGFPRAGSCRGGFPNGTQNIAVTYAAGFTVQTIADALYTVVPAWAANTAYAAGDLVSDGTYLQEALSSGTSGALAPAWAGQQNGTTPDGVQPGLEWSNTGVVQAPNQAVLASDTVILSDGGVKLFIGGTPLTRVNISPSAGEYFLVAPGIYLFNVAQAGAQVLISYTAAGTPADIVQATCEAVSLNYKRRDWEGVSSLSMKDVGQTTYTQFSMNSNVKDVVRNYTRKSMAN